MTISFMQAWRYCQWNWHYLVLLRMSQPLVRETIDLFHELKKRIKPNTIESITWDDLVPFVEAFQTFYATYHDQDANLEHPPDWNDLPGDDELFEADAEQPADD